MELGGRWECTREGLPLLPAFLVFGIHVGFGLAAQCCEPGRKASSVLVVSRDEKEGEPATVEGNSAGDTTTPQEVSGLGSLSKTSYTGPRSQPWKGSDG